MFFIRLAFWLGVVVLLLPTDEQQQARLYGTAGTAVERVTTFCDRNPRACTMGAEAWATFLKKAEFGARLVGDLLGVSARQDPAGPHNVSTRERADPRGTLSPMDVQPSWRGPPRRTGI